MSDKLIVTGDSPEAVAYALLFGIAANEKKVDWSCIPAPITADAEWLLENYSRCLRAAKGMSQK